MLSPEPQVTEASLYRRLLGTEWDLLPLAIRCMHLSEDTLEAQGTVCIHHGKSLAARLISRMFGMPPASEACPTTLAVCRENSGERWTRHFGLHRLVSTQKVDATGLLIERFGPLLLRFRVTRDAGGLRYSQVGGALTIGKAVFNLPAVLVPIVEASESEALGEGACNVRVRIAARFLGLIAFYEGTMRPLGDSR